LNDIDVFRIRAEEYANNEIDTEAFLKDRSSILNKIRSHNADVSSIQKFKFDIEQLTEYEIDLDLSRLYVSPQSVNSPNSSPP
jgi:hypothetical protein